MESKQTDDWTVTVAATESSRLLCAPFFPAAVTMMMQSIIKGDSAQLSSDQRRAQGQYVSMNDGHPAGNCTGCF